MELQRQREEDNVRGEAVELPSLCGDASLWTFADYKLSQINKIDERAALRPLLDTLGQDQLQFGWTDV